jgi:hypothetical protein
VHDRDVDGRRIVPDAIERYNGVSVTLDPVPVEWVTSEDDPMGQLFAHYGVGRPAIQAPPVRQLVWAEPRLGAAAQAFAPAGVSRARSGR